MISDGFGGCVFFLSNYLTSSRKREIVLDQAKILHQGSEIASSLKDKLRDIFPARRLVKFFFCNNGISFVGFLDSPEHIVFFKLHIFSVFTVTCISSTSSN